MLYNSRELTHGTPNTAYGNEAVSHTGVCRWFKRCGEGYEDLEVDGNDGRVSESVEMIFVRRREFELVSDGKELLEIRIRS